jgi:N-acetylneuraminic acid mutarotase
MRRLLLAAAALCCANVASGANSTNAPSALEWEKLPSLPDALGFAGPFAGVSGGALIVAGGANFPHGMPWEGGKKAWHDSVFVLPEPTAKWRIGFKLARPVAYGVSVTVKQGVVCIGGANATGHFTHVFRLRWRETRLWQEELPPLPQPNAYGCGARLGDTIYVAGGTETPDATRALKVFWALDLSHRNPRWERLEPWPGPARMLATAAAQAGSFFLVSGADLTASADGTPQRIYLKDAYRYTPGRGWKRVADLPRPAVAVPAPASALGNARFLVLGGDDGAKVGFQPPDQHPGFSREVLAYDTRTDTWTVLDTEPVSRVTTPAVQWGARIVIPSGEVRPGVRSPEVWAVKPVLPR